MLNRLEIALLDKTNVQLDLYLEDESTKTIRTHIEEMRSKALRSTPSGVIKYRLMELIEDI